MHKKNLENLQKIIKDSEGVFQIWYRKKKLYKMLKK
jgi:hypothetical protein